MRYIDKKKRPTEEDIRKALEALGLRNNECVEPKPVIEIFQNGDYKPEILMERDRSNERL